MSTVKIAFHRPLYLRPEERQPNDLVKSFDDVSLAMQYARRMAGIYAHKSRVTLHIGGSNAHSDNANASASTPA